jgi:hypothetical protein
MPPGDLSSGDGRAQMTVFAIVAHFVIGFFLSALAARELEQDSETDVFLNFLAWEIVIPFRLLLAFWRSIARPTQYKKWYYIFSL